MKAWTRTKTKLLLWTYRGEKEVVRAREIDRDLKSGCREKREQRRTKKEVVPGSIREYFNCPEWNPLQSTEGDNS